MNAANFTFAPMSPEVEAHYQRLMEHADNCMNDVKTHEFNLALHTALCGNAFPGLQRLGQDLVEQSIAMELEARDMAHRLLTSAPPVVSVNKKTAKPRPYYRPERW